VVAAVLAAGSEKAAAHRLGLSHSTVKHHLANARSKVGARTTAQLVWILAPRLPEPTGAPSRRRRSFFGRSCAQPWPAPAGRRVFAIGAVTCSSRPSPYALRISATTTW
jgi:hypothetical protein